MKNRGNILVLEAGMRVYKEPIVKKLAAVSGIDLYFASGLTATIPIDWVYPYAKGVIEFDYVKDSLLRVVERFQDEKKIRFDGVITYVEPAVHFANELQISLGLPAISSLRGKSLRNKWQMRRLCESAGVAQPRFISATSLLNTDDIRSLPIQFPLIVKPSEMTASLGVSLVRSPEEFQEALSLALQADFWDEGLRVLFGDIAQEALIEEYIPGPEYSVETVVQNGKPLVLGVTKKYSSNTGRFDEVAHRFPAPDVSPECFSKIKTLIESSHAALEIKNSLTHTEVKIADQKPVLIEINCRLGGDLISSLVEKSLDIDIGEFLVALAMGTKIDAPLKGTLPHSYEILFPHSDIDGRVVSVLPTTPNFDGACEYQAHAREGDILFRNDLIGVSRLAHLIRRVDDADASPESALRELGTRFQVKPALSFHRMPETRDYLALFQAGLEDVSALIEIEKACWDPSMAASESVIQDRIIANPESTFVAYSARNGKPLASMAVVPFDFLDSGAEKQWSHYAALALNRDYLGKIKSGDALYIVSISSVPSAPRGAGALFFKGVLDYFRQTKKRRLACAIRMIAPEQKR